MASRAGALRGLSTDGCAVSYRLGVPTFDEREGGIVFLDGGIHYVPAENYDLLDVRRG